jgi:hypothetical protein
MKTTRNIIVKFLIVRGIPNNNKEIKLAKVAPMNGKAQMPSLKSSVNRVSTYSWVPGGAVPLATLKGLHS